MEQNIICGVSFLDLFHVFIIILFSDPYGKVIIGLYENDTTDIYSFNENYASLFTIPVYLVLVNGTTEAILPDPLPTDVSAYILHTNS